MARAQLQVMGLERGAADVQLPSLLWLQSMAVLIPLLYDDGGDGVPLLRFEYLLC